MSTRTAGSRLDAREVARLVRRAATLAYSGASADDCMASALDLVCAFTGWPLGHIYLLDRRQMRLVSSGIWHDEDPARFAPFVDATRGADQPIGIGLSGRMLASGKPAWITDVAKDSNFPRAIAALECGISAGFGFPIVSPLGIEGIAEFFAPRVEEPDDLLLDLLSHIGLALGSALDRTRAQLALEASEARRAEAERIGRMGAWLYEVNEDILHWSPELRALYGLDPASAPTTFDQYLAQVHADDASAVKRAIDQAIESRGSFEYEYRLVLPGGVACWAHARGRVLDGPTLQLAGYCQDITERKRREDAARIAQERLAEAQRIAHLGSWYWDLGTGAITWSDELYRIYGLEPGSSPATFEDYLVRVHPEDRDRVRTAVVRTAETLEPFEHDYRIIRPDGEERMVHARGEIVEQVDRSARRLAGSCHDITERWKGDQERERLEEQLQLSRRLESLGQLASGVAHDFNNLLAVILSYTGFAREELAALDHELGDRRIAGVQADVDQIARAAVRAGELTRQLLAFGRRELAHPRVIRIDDVVRDVERFLRRTIGEHVELRIGLAADLWPVRADPGQIEQILLNLAVNARDAMAGGGELAIETDNTLIVRDAEWKGIEPGRYVRLRVSDTGQGMVSEVADRVFEPFFTTKPPGQGTGLGLATVYGIVAQSGGTIRVDSAPRRGTTFTILLPASDEEEPAPEVRAPLRRRRATPGETVLLVEDEDAMREVVRRILERNGYQVIACASGPDAIEEARKGIGIQLLLSDVVMPHMLGHDVASAVTALSPATRVLYMSGYGAPAPPVEANAPMVAKPFSEEELLQRVREALDGPAGA